MTALLEIRNLRKAYPGVVANDDVSLTVQPGEIHALLGENGAGKSTLVKAIYGLIAPDQGQMLWQGQLYAPRAPNMARATGVAMVFQHFSLFDALNVAENVALGMDHPPRLRDLSTEIARVSTDYGLPLDPNRRVGDLSAGEKQRVEIIRCLLQKPSLLIMDEPTSVLTPQEAETLFAALHTLKDQGKSILYISHKLKEIRALCDQATILRHGKVVGTADPQTATAADLAELMVGTRPTAIARQVRAMGDPILTVQKLSLAPRSDNDTPLRDISFVIRAGEILGIGGVAGNGQDALLAALSGERSSQGDSIDLTGTPIGALGPTARRALGLLSAPEERLGHAAAPAMTLTENTALTGWDRSSLARGGWLNWGKAQQLAQDVITRFDVRTPGPQAVAQSLSGGNLQKFVMGREILQDPKVLVVNQPTWGVDAAAAAAIRQALTDLADQGTAVIVISQDLDELTEIADTFAALNEGRLSPTHPMADLTQEQIGLMLGGDTPIMCSEISPPEAQNPGPALAAP
ncbi:ABC transporter ATP-binding protein [Actibacterium sp. 188UL27-1]|uniref:ABC transporter ATP-binding protein n=1 Tax=Actibacterium sp. 188UL27-1 TaxID=2786961 RepID=UPI00195A9F36|nr:ABC transporter ATP-binding protein [Actibacterium sp. 188UL27-1]MBM7066634.1 ABC transporter ATP-binding protein [Actibacterium sp. 188UL27-1]